MVKTPRTRHSKPREPMTIDLDPGEVQRVEEAAGLDPRAEEAVADTVARAEAAEEPSPDVQTATSQPETADPAPEPSRPADPPPPSEPRRATSPLLAGLAGGALALVGAGLLQFTGLIGAPGGATAPVDATLRADLDALEAEIAALRADGGADALSGRVDGLDQALAQVRSDLEALRAEVQTAAPGGGADMAALETRLGDVEKALAALGTGSGAPSDLSAVNERIAGLEALAKAASDANAAVEGRLGALEQSLATLTARVDAQAAQPKVAMAIAAAALKSAVERGVPFSAEVETFAAVAPDAPGLAELRTHAAAGVPSRAEILAETDAVATAMIAAANPPDPDAGFFQRLLSSAGSLVSVRPIGAVEGEGVPETVARMEAAVQSGDLAQALAEFDGLPEAAKAAGSAYGGKLRARVEVERLVDEAVAAAMKA